MKIASSARAPGRPSNVSDRVRVTLLVSIGITLLLYLVIPYGRMIGYPLVLISTLVHELGHGVAAILAGGTFHELLMFRDGSGLAYHSGTYSGFERGFVAAGGLVGPAVGAAFCFVFARRAHTARYCMAAIGAALVIAEIAVVRNGFGLVFVGAFAAVCLALALKGSDDLVQGGLAFLGVQLAFSTYLRSDYLFTQWADTEVGRGPSDSQAIAQAMGFGSYWFWGVVCAAFSVLVLAVGAWLVLRRSK